MKRSLARGLALALVGGAALVAYAIGNGDVTANAEVTVITIASTTGGGAATTTLQNTTSSTSYSTLVGSDATCDPALMFSIVGGNPFVISPMTNRTVNLTCPPRGSAAMRRCLYHATSSSNGTPLVDFMTVCLYGSSATLAPQQTALDFGSVVVGETAMLPLDLQNNGTPPISRVYLQTTDLAGNFQFSTPCNPDAPFCDEDVMAVSPGGTLSIQVRCTPQTPGMHTAQLYVGTNGFQLLAQPVTLTCMGTGATSPVLGVNPTSIDLPAPIEVTNGSASTVVHLTNAGGSTLLISDVRTVDVDTGASFDWTYSASGDCSGSITLTSTPCSLEGGEQVDLNVTFDASKIGRRRATLLISYKDTIDRTKEIPLDATGLGATLEALGGVSTLSFGQVPVGRNSTIDYQLVNHGNRDITAQLSMNPVAPQFALSPTTSAVVVPSVAKTISVTCAPTSATEFTTTVTAQAIDAFSGSPVAVNATCDGSSLALYGNPTAINLGEIRTGGGEVTRTIQLLSTTAPTQLTLSGTPQLESANDAIAISALSGSTTPASFELTIDPSMLPEGQLALTILASDTAGETLRIPVSAKIVVASYEVTGSIDLGTFCVGQATTSSNVSLASDGTATIALGQPTLDKSPSPFQLANTSPSTYPSSLAAGTTATVSITPQRQTAVTQIDDTLTWHTDVEDEQNAITNLTARFIDQGAAISPSVLNFGQVTVHWFTEDGQRVVIQNCNPTPVQLDAPKIKTPFRIDSPTFPVMLNPNETSTFSVGFHPTRIGIVMDTLRITSPQLPGTPLEVTLIGEGVPLPEPPSDAGSGSNGPGDTSFYACSCNSRQPGGVIPIVIALVCVLFPRRRASFTRRRKADGSATLHGR